jgi:hypothetical protein
MTASFFSTVPAGTRTVEASAFVPAPAPATREWYDSDPLEVVDGRFTRGELSAAFSAIQNPENWKLAIGPVAIPADLLPVASAACVFFAGSRLTVEAATANRFAIVTAPGYYATIGA